MLHSVICVCANRLPKLNVSNGAKRNSATQRNQSLSFWQWQTCKDPKRSVTTGSLRVAQSISRHKPFEADFNPVNWRRPNSIAELIAHVLSRPQDALTRHIEGSYKAETSIKDQGIAVKNGWWREDAELRWRSSGKHGGRLAFRAPEGNYDQPEV